MVLDESLSSLGTVIEDRVVHAIKPIKYFFNGFQFLLKKPLNVKIIDKLKVKKIPNENKVNIIPPKYNQIFYIYN